VKRWFMRMPIRQKLVTMILATSGIVVTLASIGHFVNDYRVTRKAAVEELSAHAALILDSAKAALEFGDERVTGEVLRTLHNIPEVRTACLYGPDQRLFDHYQNDSDSASCPPTAPPDGQSVAAGRITVTQTLYTNESRSGSVHMRADLTEVEEQLRAQIVIIAAVLLIALGVATFISAWLQSLVSEPIRALAKTASSVSSRGDYSIRATRTTEDELGVLVDAFNGMLDRIQMREEELSHANDDLRREVTERRRAEQERAELLVREREANRLKDEFLATLSHELRTPLNAILGWTRLLRGKMLPDSSIDPALEKVERNAQMQARLVEDLLEVSRITTGKLRLDMREFDLVALARTAVDSIRPTAEARGVIVERDFRAPAMPTVGDPDRLQQVVWNLLSNAVKFTPSGGRVTLSLRRVGDTDEIHVSDTGVGIDPSFLPNVFDTFRQADASATRAHGGLGLGLSIVRHLVEVHGGSVAAFSEGRDRGSTFTVRLPVRSLSSLNPQAPPDAAVLIPGDLLLGAGIVVVDDDRDTRELLQSVLAAAGAEVRAAGSADEALAFFREGIPDAIVSDIGMPGRDGYSLMHELRSSPGLMPRVAVALSAYAAPRDREQSVLAGFQEHLAKPIDPVALVRILHDRLAEAAQNEASS
jgi:signal transduction histidine kinase/ActR/RegA family two-component response regulator